jgi:hypothetical protein
VVGALQIHPYKHWPDHLQKSDRGPAELLTFFWPLGRKPYFDRDADSSSNVPELLRTARDISPRLGDGGAAVPPDDGNLVASGEVIDRALPIVSTAG